MAGAGSPVAGGSSSAAAARADLSVGIRKPGRAHVGSGVKRADCLWWESFDQETSGGFSGGFATTAWRAGLSRPASGADGQLAPCAAAGRREAGGEGARRASGGRAQAESGRSRLRLGEATGVKGAWHTP